jgi:hypothetical protein
VIVEKQLYFQGFEITKKPNESTGERGRVPVFSAYGMLVIRFDLFFAACGGIKSPENSVFMLIHQTAKMIARKAGLPGKRIEYP